VTALNAWRQRMKVEVGTYNDWHKISDHVPLMVDLDL
jgi:endonuclease/exonuclease/phosphatase family metal-dependent hydrolase